MINFNNPKNKRALAIIIILLIIAMVVPMVVYLLP